MFLKDKIGRFSRNQSSCRVTKNAILKKVVLRCRHFPKPISHFLISLLAEKQLIDDLGSWRTGSATHQANLCKGTYGLKLWITWWRSWVRSLIAFPDIPRSSLTVRKTALRRLTGPGYRKKWSAWKPHNLPPTMIAKGCNLQIFCMFDSTAVTT